MFNKQQQYSYLLRCGWIPVFWSFSHKWRRCWNFISHLIQSGNLCWRKPRRTSRCCHSSDITAIADVNYIYHDCVKHFVDLKQVLACRSDGCVPPHLHICPAPSARYTNTLFFWARLTFTWANRMTESFRETTQLSSIGSRMLDVTIISLQFFSVNVSSAFLHIMHLTVIVPRPESLRPSCCVMIWSCCCCCCVDSSLSLLL